MARALSLTEGEAVGLFPYTVGGASSSSAMPVAIESASAKETFGAGEDVMGRFATRSGGGLLGWA